MQSAAAAAAAAERQHKCRCTCSAGAGDGKSTDGGSSGCGAHFAVRVVRQHRPAYSGIHNKDHVGYE